MLRAKRVQVNDLCPSCNDYPETVVHTLVCCSHAIACWEKVQNFHISGDYSSFADWLKLVFEQKRKEEVCIVVMICWMLWKSRNDLRWNQSSLGATEVVESAYLVLNQWKSVQDRTFDHTLGYMSQEDGDEHWSLPSVNSVEVNTDDAAIFKESNCYSYAFVIRDHEGNLIEARSSCLRGCPSVELGKALGIKEALSWVKNADLNNVTVESESLQIVQAVRSSFMCYSYLG